RAALAERLAEPHPQALMELLADAAPAADGQLPDTGVGLATERLLSSVFIASPSYGTRASSVVRVHADGTREMIERSFGPSGARLGEVSLVLPPG
ncbi:NRDE family protein, partial [Pseudomonas aeruginosa]